MQRADIAIAGAGIIGLTTALELASDSRSVLVFERGRAMREASWAAAGMLAANDPENPPALRSLSAFSLSLYPAFLAKVKALSGKKIPVRTTHALQGVHSLPPETFAIDSEVREKVAAGLQSNGLKFFQLTEQSIDPRDLAEALPLAVKAAGVTLLEQTAVTSATSESGSVRIDTSAGVWNSEHFVNAGGAWAADLADLPIAPRKGQMLLVENASESLNAVIRTPELYLVPRGNGRIVIGATVEDAGYDKRVDPAAIAALHHAAAELWPPVRTARIVDSWTGLRPVSPDSLPLLGKYAPHCWLATGHFRNGILLAPGTAQLLRAMILNEPLRIDITPFQCGRFASSLA